MKRTIPAITSTLIFTISFSNVTAQKSTDTSRLDHYKNEIAYVPVSNAKTEINDHSTLYKINFKAVRDFMTRYPTIINEKWEILNDGYLASFVSNAIWIKNFYKKEADGYIQFSNLMKQNCRKM